MSSSSAGPGQKIAGGLANGAKELATMAGKRLLSSATDKVGSTIGSTTERLTDYVSNGGGPGLLSAVTGRGKGNGGSSKDKSLKVTNIVEQIDIAAPIRLVYDQWTRFTDFPTFMKKVETVEQEEDEKLKWKAQVLWSHRNWESTIIEQVPDRRIVWQSEGQKGSVDGTVTFHELAPELTRVMVNLLYHPQGLFERTGNIWRAQGRRARLELKHFARHVMNESILHPDEIEGWRGEIRDGEVVKDNEQARQEEEESQQEGGRSEGEGRNAEAGRTDEEGRGKADRGKADRGKADRPDDERPDQGRRPHGRRSDRGRDDDSAPASRRGGEDRPASRPARRSEQSRRPSRQGRE